MNSLKYKLSIIAIGNILRSDDGLAPYILKELVQEKWSKSIYFHEVTTSFLDCLDVLAQSEQVIILDAIIAGEQPGHIYVLTEEQVKINAIICKESHGQSILDILALARIISGFPQKVLFMGIEPANLDYGIGLSEEINAMLPFFLNSIKTEIHHLMFK